MLLNKGTLGTKKVLSETAVAEMQKLQTGAAKIGFVPKETEGFSYGLGHWIKPEDMMEASPGLNGVWPWIDVRKKYACVIFGELKRKEDQKNTAAEIISQVSTQF